MKRLCPRVEQMAVSSRNAVSHRCFQIGGGGINRLTLKPPWASARYPGETYLHIPNAAGRFDIALLKVSPLIVIYLTFKATQQRALVEAVMVKRIGKGYVLTLVGKPPYEAESGGSTSKGVIFDCESGDKRAELSSSVNLRTRLTLLKRN